MLLAASLLVTNACGGADGESEPAPSVAAPTFTPTAVPNPATAAGRIAFLGESSSGRLKKYDIYTINQDGADLTRLTEGEGDHGDLRWSPDGAWLAFTSSRDGQWDAYLMSADGEQTRRVTQTRGRERSLIWSPDSRYLGMPGPNPEVKSSNEFLDILIYDLESEELVNFTNTLMENEVALTWSMDGQYLFFVAKDYDIVRMDFSCIDDPATCQDTTLELGVQSYLPLWWSNTTNALGYGALQEDKVYAALMTFQGESLQVLDSVPLSLGTYWVNPSPTGDYVVLPAEGWAFVIWDIVQDRATPLSIRSGAVSPAGDQAILCSPDEGLIIFDLDQGAFQRLKLPVTPSCYSLDWGPSQDATNQ
jgi:dipeptidyl aminopeptidase/acylaminoacyl peptidase